MLKKITLGIACLALVLPAVAAGQVNVDTDTAIRLDSSNLDLVISAGSSFDAMVVNDGSIEVKLSAGQTAVFISTDRKTIINDRSITLSCPSDAGSPSALTISTAGTTTITVSNSACTPSSQPGSGGGGPSAPATCDSWTYSAWSQCAAGRQTRSVVASSPLGCSGGSPVLSQACSVQATSTQAGNAVATSSARAADRDTDNLDSDQDGINDGMEKALGTDPQKKDTDGDGYEDGQEVRSGYDPLRAGKFFFDKALAGKLRGMILLQVENRGEAWYVNPANLLRYYLGRPADAFKIMRKVGLGVKHDVVSRSKAYPNRLVGMILIDVEDKGKAYYISPRDKKAYYLARPDDAFQIMRKLGVGITNGNLRKIQPGL